MPFAANSRHDVAYVPEVTYGTTPTTPTMLLLPNTSVSVGVTKETFRSNEITSDRQIRDLRHGVRRVAGDIGFELKYGAFDQLLESALFGAWTTNVLKAGTTMKSFSLERRFLDIAQYEIFTGCVANTLSLTINPNMITGSVGFIGKDGTLSGTSVDASPDAAVTHPAFDGFSGSFEEGGVSDTSITSIQLSLANGIDPAFVVGSAVTPQLFPGMSDLTGTVTAYFPDATKHAKFINETESSLEITLEGASGGDLVILIPRIKYTSSDHPVTTAAGGVIQTMNFQALRDSTEATNLKLTRVPAP